MEPRIQYAETEDGVNIAYWTIGEGIPFVQMPSAPYNSTLRLWSSPDGRRWCEQMAQNRKLVRYDSRGFGHSERDITDFSLDAHVLDLEAVIDHVTPGKVALFAYWQSGPAAIAYAVRHPERVSHLLLWCTSANGGDIYAADTYETLSELAERDWEFFTESWAQMTFGWSDSERARQYAAFLRESATPETLRAAWDAVFKFDVTDSLTQVRSSTLVLQRRALTSPRMEVAHALAARIPDARLAVFEGDSAIPYLGDAEQVLETINEFLGEGEEVEATASNAPQEAAVHTILFTDIESSTALRRKLGDAIVQELVRTHNAIVRAALGEHAGQEIKHTGDGIMASFSTATSALQCSIAIQQGVASHVEEYPDAPLGVYVGLNAGEPIAEEQDLFGTSVDLARRICDHAEPGQILASNVVRELAEGKGFLFGDIGDVVPKGFEQPVRLYEVRWREDG